MILSMLINYGNISQKLASIVNGPLAQLVEHCIHIAKVRSSRLLGSTRLYIKFVVLRLFFKVIIFNLLRYKNYLVNQIFLL